MRRLTKVALLLMLPSIAAAAEQGGVYRISSVDGRYADHGSSVAIDLPDKRQHFLTVGHVVGEDMRVFNDGRYYAVEEVARWNTNLDPMVLLRQVKPAGRWRWYPVATENVERGEQLNLAGFPAGRFFGFWARVIDVQHMHNSYLVTSGEAKHGASGGAVLNRDGQLVGLISSVVGGQTLSVNVWDAVNRSKPPQGEQVQWRCDNGRCYPVYSPPPLFMPQPQYPVRPQTAPVANSRPTTPPPSQSTTRPVDMDDVLRDVRLEVVRWLEDNKAQLKGESPQIDAAEVARYLAENHPDAVKGEAGTDGSSVTAEQVAMVLARDYREQIAGPQGKVGVPDNEDIRNWLVGAMSDTATRAALAQLLADTLQEDPRVQDLILRLEAVEKQDERIVPVIVKNSDGTVFSEAPQRRAFDPIVINLAPPKEQ